MYFKGKECFSIKENGRNKLTPLEVCMNKCLCLEGKKKKKVYFLKKWTKKKIKISGHFLLLLLFPFVLAFRYQLLPHQHFPQPSSGWLHYLSSGLFQQLPIGFLSPSSHPPFQTSGEGRSGGKAPSGNLFKMKIMWGTPKAQRLQVPLVILEFKSLHVWSKLGF